MKYAHLRGWLGVFTVIAALDAFGSLSACFSVMQRWNGGEEMSPYFLDATLAQIIEIGLFALGIMGLMRILNRHPRTRRFWIGLLVAKIPAELISMTLVGGIVLAEARAAGYSDPDLGPATARFLLRTLLFAPWIAYWIWSRRVRETFSSGGASSIEAQASS